MRRDYNQASVQKWCRSLLPKIFDNVVLSCGLAHPIDLGHIEHEVVNLALSVTCL